MTTANERARGLRRKARTLHRRADAALAMRRVWDATELRTAARELERIATRLEAADTALEHRARHRAPSRRDACLPAREALEELNDLGVNVRPRGRW